jgi:hypothetical protein
MIPKLIPKMIPKMIIPKLIPKLKDLCKVTPKLIPMLIPKIIPKKGVLLDLVSTVSDLRDHPFIIYVLLPSEVSSTSIGTQDGKVF